MSRKPFVQPNRQRRPSPIPATAVHEHTTHKVWSAGPAKGRNRIESAWHTMRNIGERGRWKREQTRKGGNLDALNSLFARQRSPREDP